MLSDLLQAIRPASLSAPIGACALVGAMLAPALGLADESKIALPIYGVPTAVHSPFAPARGAATASDLDKRALAPHSGLELSGSDPRFALIELPPDTLATGSYKRPHHALGYRWQAAESWLRDQGFDAQTCYLPMARLHSKLSASGASGTLWIYGRCTFR